MDRPQRLAGRVLPDGVDLEPGRPPEPRARRPGVTGPWLENDDESTGHARAHEDLGGLVEPAAHALEPERVRDRHLERLEPVAAAGELREDDESGASPASRGLRSIPPSRCLIAIVPPSRRRRPARTSTTRSSPSTRSPGTSRRSISVEPRHDARPDRGGERREDEPEPDDDERRRAERP